MLAQSCVTMLMWFFEQKKAWFLGLQGIILSSTIVWGISGQF